MNTIFTIGHNDIRLYLKDRTSIIWLVVIPLAFVYFASFASRPPGDPWDVRPEVLVENRDERFLGALFLEVLGQEGVNPVTGDTDSSSSDIHRGLIIPENFTDLVLQKKEVSLEFFEIAGSSDTDMRSNLVEINLIRAIINMNGCLVEYATSTGNKELNENGLRELIQSENLVELDSRFAGRKPIPVGFNMSLPGIIVMYLLMNLLAFGGTNLASDRRSGVLRRLSSNPVSHTQIIAGKIYGLMLLGIFQTTALLLFGQFVFKVNIGENLLGISLTLIIFSWVSASLGLLIGSLVKSEDRVVGLAIMISIPTAALGGCWWHMEIVPETLQNIAHITPTAWAMDCLNLLITFGADFKNILKPLSVLAGYGLVINLISAKFFRV